MILKEILGSTILL